MREQAITRTVSVYEAQCIVVNLDNNATETKTVRTVKNTDKARQAALESNEKLAHTISVETLTEHYKMKLADFIKLATKTTEAEAADSGNDTDTTNE